MSVKICKFLSAKKTQVSTLELRIAQNFTGTKYLYKISSMNFFPSEAFLKRNVN